MWESVLKARKLEQRFYILGIEFNLSDIYNSQYLSVSPAGVWWDQGVKESKEFKKTIEELHEEIQKKIPEIKITSVRYVPELYGKLSLMLRIESKYIEDIVLIFHPVSVQLSFSAVERRQHGLLQPLIQIKIYPVKEGGSFINEYESQRFGIKDDMVFWIKEKYDSYQAQNGWDGR